VFEKKNADTLSKHWSYNYTINLEEGVQLAFKPIYNLSQDELTMLCEYIDENLKKGGSFDIPNLQSMPLSSLSIRKMVFYECVSIILNWIDSP
jgi:hypothetical protein